MPFERTLGEVFAAHSDALKDEFRKCIPATVTAVNASVQTVDVQTAIRNPTFDEYGNATFDAALSFRNVPLGVIRGGGFFVWVPVAVGDSVLLVFSDLSCDTWRASTPGGQPTQPGWLGKHTADSPFALPMVAPDAAALSTADASKLVIGKDGTAAQIKISASDIELGASATDALALASKIDAVFTALQTFMGFFGASAIVAPSTGVAIPTLQAAASAVSSAVHPTGSTLIKAQ